MRSRLHLIARREELLRELLARTQARERDTDVPIDLQAGQVHQVFGKLHDLDRVSHVEHERLATAAKGGRLEYQLHRLRDGHEVPAHFRMRDRDRPTCLDLLLEERNDAPAAGQHVAKPDRDVRFARTDGCLVHQPLGQELGRAHHVCRIDRLVRRNQHKMGRPGALGSGDHVRRAENVVGHRFFGIAFHQRNVLVRGCVENCLGPVGLEHPVNPGGVTDVGNNRHDAEPGKFHQQFVVNLEDAVLAVSQQDQLAGTQARDLSANLAPDRAPGTGDEHRHTIDQVRNRALVRLDRWPAQQVLDLDISQLIDIHLAGEIVVDPGDDLGGKFGAVADVANLADLRARHPRHRDDHLGDRVVPRERRDLLAAAQHRNPVDHVPVLGRVVVYESGDLQLQLRIGAQLACDHGSGVTRADDEHPATYYAASEFVAQVICQAQGEPGASHEDQGEQRVDDRYREPDAGAGRQERSHQQRVEDPGDDARGDNAEADVGEFIDAGVTPVAPIEAEGPKSSQLAKHRDDGERHQMAAIGFHGVERVDTQEEGNQGNRCPARQVGHQEGTVSQREMQSQAS